MKTPHPRSTVNYDHTRFQTNTQTHIISLSPRRRRCFQSQMGRGPGTRHRLCDRGNSAAAVRSPHPTRHMCRHRWRSGANTHTHTYTYMCSSHIDKKQDKTIYNQQCENMKLHPPEVFWSEGKTWMFCLLLVLLFKNFLVTQMKSIHLIMFFVNKHYTEGTFTLTHWLPWYAKEAYNGKQDPRKCHQRGILTCKFCHLLQRMKLGWLGLIWHRWWS